MLRGTENMEELLEALTDWQLYFKKLYMFMKLVLSSVQGKMFRTNL